MLAFPIKRRLRNNSKAKNDKTTANLTEKRNIPESYENVIFDSSSSENNISVDKENTDCPQYWTYPWSAQCS